MSPAEELASLPGGAVGQGGLWGEAAPSLHCSGNTGRDVKIGKYGTGWAWELSKVPLSTAVDGT